MGKRKSSSGINAHTHSRSSSKKYSNILQSDLSVWVEECFLNLKIHLKKFYRRLSYLSRHRLSHRAQTYSCDRRWNRRKIEIYTEFVSLNLTMASKYRVEWRERARTPALLHTHTHTHPYPHIKSKAFKLIITTNANAASVCWCIHNKGKWK